MSVRTRRVLSVIALREGKSGSGVAVSHPCGHYAWSSWLRWKPAHSRAVSRDLAGDAGSPVGDGVEWNMWSFASAIEEMSAAGCALSPEAKSLLGKWVRAGRPRPWADDERRCFLLLDNEVFVNCEFDDMAEWAEHFRCAGSEVTYHTPSPEQRANILRGTRLGKPE